MSIGGALSGGKEEGTKKEKGTSTTTGTKTSQLELDDEAITRIIQETLGGANGLAGVFNKDNASGIYNSTASAQASGDLVAKLVGELAKVTGKTVENVDSTTKTVGRTDTSGWNIAGEMSGGIGDWRG